MGERQTRRHRGNAFALLHAVVLCLAGIFMGVMAGIDLGWVNKD